MDQQKSIEERAWFVIEVVLYKQKLLDDISVRLIKIWFSG